MKIGSTKRVQWLLSVGVVLLTACTTSPLGRRQLTLFPADQMEQMGLAAFQELGQELPRSKDAAAGRFVECVTRAVIAEVPGSGARRWEVVLFEQSSPNAFALPSGHIGVHTGMLAVAKNQHQLAAVIGHELAHVLANHTNERVSTAFATQSAIDLTQAIGGAASPARQQLLGLLGVGAQYGILMPFGRTQEREADKLGLDLMSAAGFDPREAITLWRNMDQAGGGAQPPEFLSTHPSHATRIADLQARMQQALSRQAGALAAGKRPGCSR